MLRTLGLILLWIGVAGLGLFTLCSGAMVMTGEPIFWLVALVGALLTWGAWFWASRLSGKASAEEEKRRRDPNYGAQP